jgi:hypothetical protein
MIAGEPVAPAWLAPVYDSENERPALAARLIGGVGDSVDLEPFVIEQGYRATAVA